MKHVMYMFEFYRNIQ